MIARWCAGCLMLAALAGCAGNKAGTQTRSTTGAREDVAAAAVRLMTGSFSSEEQSKGDPDNFLDIRLHMTPIWTSRTDGAWLYVEQAAAARLDRPYRQRIYRVATAKALGRTDAPADTVISEVYELPGDPLVFASAWREPSRFDALTPESLQARKGCAVFLRGSGTPIAPGGPAFVGATRNADCASTLRGATYATSEVEIRPDGLRTWDRGYDASGKQVWGAEKGPYEFKRVQERPAG